MRPTTEREDKVKNATRSDVLFPYCLIVRHLPTTMDQPLLLRRNARLLLDLLLDPADFVIEFDLQLYFFTGEGLDFNQHGANWFRLLVVIGR